MKTRQSAFTLLEIMLVVAIIGVLLSAAIYKMAPALDVAKGTKTKADVQSIRTMLLSYNGMNGSYPESLSALVPTLYGRVAERCLWVALCLPLPGPKKPGQLRSFFRRSG